MRTVCASIYYTAGWPSTGRRTSPSRMCSQPWREPGCGLRPGATTRVRCPSVSGPVQDLAGGRRPSGRGDGVSGAGRRHRPPRGQPGMPGSHASVSASVSSGGDGVTQRSGGRDRGRGPRVALPPGDRLQAGAAAADVGRLRQCGGTPLLLDWHGVASLDDPSGARHRAAVCAARLQAPTAKPWRERPLSLPETRSAVEGYRAGAIRVGRPR